MVFFLAQDGKTQVALDSEATVSVSLPSIVSKSSTMNGTSISDDVIEGNAVITVQGRVTYSKLKSQENNLNPIEFQEAIQEARRNRNRFTVNVKDYGQPLLQDYEDCVISNVDINVDKYSDTITVGLVFEQVFVSEAAKKTYLAPKRSEDAKPTVSDTKDSGNSSKTQVEEKKSRTIFKAVSEEGRDFLVGDDSGTNN